MKRRLSFQVKLFLALVCFSCLLLVLLGTILFHFIDRQLHHDLGQRARVQASQIALMPGLAAMVAARDIPGIARLIQPLRAQSDASYIVIGDTEEQHLYHSESPERINLPMIGGDNAEVSIRRLVVTCHIPEASSSSVKTGSMFFLSTNRANTPLSAASTAPAGSA